MRSPRTFLEPVACAVLVAMTGCTPIQPFTSTVSANPTDFVNWMGHHPEFQERGYVATIGNGQDQTVRWKSIGQADREAVTNAAHERGINVSFIDAPFSHNELEEIARASAKPGLFGKDFTYILFVSTEAESVQPIIEVARISGDPRDVTPPELPESIRSKFGDQIRIRVVPYSGKPVR